MKIVESEIERLKAELGKRDAELQALRRELQKVREKALDLEDSRRAMLFMLEDLNESAAVIKKGKKEWEATFDSISDPIFIHDREFNIIRMNKAYMAEAGVPPADILGKPFYHVFPLMEGPSASCLKKLRGEAQEAEEEVAVPGGKVFKMRAYSVRDSEGVVVYSVHVMEDITESKQASIEKANLYEKIKEEAEVSSSLLAMFETLNNSLDERELIRNVMNLAPRYMKFDRAGIFYYDEKLSGFSFAGGYGFSPEEEGSLASRILGRSDIPGMEKLLKDEMVVAGDASGTGLINGGVVGLFRNESAVMVPISFRGKVVGGIYADNKSGKAVEQKEMSLLKGLADGITIALQNSRLYRESVERLMELSGKVETIKTMAQLDKEILSNIDKGTILRTATALVNRVIPSERTSIVLREGQRFRIVCEWGAGSFQDKTYPLEGSHFETFEKNRISLFFSDIERDDCPYHREQSSVGIKSILLVPLATQEGVIGFLDIGSAQYGRMTPEHLSTAENIASQISVALENSRLYEELQRLLINTITSLASAIDAKSPWTKGHSERVTRYAVEAGREIGLPEKELERLRLAGLLHDVGKIGTFDVLLDKPGRLTAEEFELVKQHPRKGAEILAPITQLSDLIPVILHHHERYDGNGYPDSLRGEEIPLQARILCVADSLDSMTADRPYRPAPGIAYAVSEFRRCSGTQFDPKVVDVFLKILERDSVKGPAAA